MERRPWHHGGVTPAEVGQIVVSRRVELGYPTRAAFAAVVGLTARTLSDIEVGRRTSYDRSTLARVEQALDWEAGHLVGLLDGSAEPKAEQPAPPPDLLAEFGTFKGLLTWVSIDDSRLALMLEVADLDTADMWEVMKMIRLRRQEQLDQLMVEVAEELRRRGARAPEDPRSHDWIDEWIAQRRPKGAAG